MFELDYQKKSQEIITWLKKTIQSAGFTDVVIALSGGIDSALSATFAVKALGKEHVHVLLLPYGELSKKSTEDAKIVAKYLELPEENIQEFDIRPVVEMMSQQTSDEEDISLSPGLGLETVIDKHTSEGKNKDLRKGNIMARIRMVYVYDMAKKMSALVVGTENKSEYYLSYFTRFGDEASDIEPIRSLYKTQVQDMARFLEIPTAIIEKAPSAGLWEGQSDEGEFGFTYADADRVLYHHFDEGLGEEAIVNLGIPQETVKKVLEWVAKNDFKHKLPYIFES